MRIEQYMMADPERAAGVKRRLTEKTTPNPETGCLEWTAKARANGGYGTICVGRRGQVRAHRAAWTLYKGEIPDGMYVCHKCDNPLCCNVDHLFLGTPLDNMLDKEAKGRGVKPPTHRGEAHHNSTMTDDEVRFVRNSTEKSAILAAKFGVSDKTIYRIKSGKTRMVS